MVANLTVVSVIITKVSAAIAASVGGVTAAGIAFRVFYMSNGDDFTTHESLRHQSRPGFLFGPRAKSGIEGHLVCIVGMILRSD